MKLSGLLGDPANTALVASDLGAAPFADDLALANNVALYVMGMRDAPKQDRMRQLFEQRPGHDTLRPCSAIN